MGYLCGEAEQWVCWTGLDLHAGRGQFCGTVIFVNGNLPQYNLLFWLSSKSITYPVFKVGADPFFFFFFLP